jgi:hypothetical protein
VDIFGKGNPILNWLLCFTRTAHAGVLCNRDLTLKGKRNGLLGRQGGELDLEPRNGAQQGGRMAGLVNEIRRTDNSGNGFQEQANRAARANRQCYGTLAGRPAEAARVIQMCTGNAGWKASAHINVSGHSLPGTHNRDVHAERSHTFTGHEIRSGHYRTLSGGLKRHLKFELSEFEWLFITFWRAVLPTSGQALSASGPGSTVRTGLDGEGNADFSRARWFYRQSARPAIRRARTNYCRAREKPAAK